MENLISFKNSPSGDLLTVVVALAGASGMQIHGVLYFSTYYKTPFFIPYRTLDTVLSCDCILIILSIIILN